MDSDSWSSRFSASKRHQYTLQSRSDLYLGGFEEMDVGDDEIREEYPCPFCSEDFDIVGLCCHIDDEHPVEAKRGVCPVCGTRVGMDMVGHIAMQHGNFFKMQRRRRSRKGSSGSHSTLSLLRKELREGHLQSLLGGSASLISSSNIAPDPLLSSFIYNSPVEDALRNVQPHASDEGTSIKRASDEKSVESVEPCLSEKDHKEKTRRSEFVQQLFLSTILDDALRM